MTEKTTPNFPKRTNMKKDFNKWKAKDLFMKGVILTEIARRLKKSRITIRNWIAEGGWEAERDALVKDLEDASVEDWKAIKSDSVKMSRAIMAKFAQDINDGTADIKAGDCIRSMEFLAKVGGYDVQKTEITGNLGLSDLEILKIAQEVEEEKKD